MKKSQLLEIFRSWVGVKEPDHAFIIDIYNTFFDLNGGRPRGYRVTYYDAWCATGLSSAIIEAGGGFDYPLECGCQEMINLYKERGLYIGDRNYTPESGDIIFYDWQGDGHSDHVGLVEEVNGSAIIVIECNNNDMVKRRTISVGNSNIAGYALPKYDKEEEEKKIVNLEDIRVADGLPVFRLYDGHNYHFITASPEEGQALINVGWEYEGVGFVVPKEGKEVSRYVSQTGAIHAYTITDARRGELEAGGWKKEGCAFLAKDAPTIPYMPVYEVVNPNNGDFVYTTRATEYDDLTGKGWTGEGIAFYAIR